MLDEDDDDDGRIGIDLWIPELRWSAVNGLRCIDSVADAIDRCSPLAVFREARRCTRTHAG